MAKYRIQRIRQFFHRRPDRFAPHQVTRAETHAAHIRQHASALAGLETAPAAVVVTLPSAEVGGKPAAAVAFSRAGKFHPLGLFTLHSVWRI